MKISLRLTGETEVEFRQRIDRTACLAKHLIDACLENACVQEYITDESLPFYTTESVREDPIVRIEYEQASAFGGIGETLRATKSKHWGEGPQVMPLKSDDWFYPERITYQYRENSLFIRRFLQRKRMKELLGKKHRKLVSAANYKRNGWKIFREHSLTPEIEREIEQRLGLTAKQFWRAVRGKILFTSLPLHERQRQFSF